MILYYNTGSPFSRAVEILISMLELNNQFEFKYIDEYKDEQLKEPYISINPRHVVPFLVDNELKVNESRTINAYLCDKFQSNPLTSQLYPRDLYKRTLINEMLHFDAAELSSSLIAMVYIKIEAVNPPQNLIYRLKQMLTYLEYKLKQTKKFSVGRELTLADISLATSLSLMDIVEDIVFEKNQTWRQEFPSIANYYALLREDLPKFAQLTDSSSQELIDYVRNAREKALNNQ